MLRNAILFGAIALVVILPLIAVAMPATWPMLVVALLILVGCVYDRRYGFGAAPPGSSFQPTSERFVDPETGRVMRVFADPRTGARRYVDDGEASSTAP